MANLPETTNPIQIEETDFEAPVGESMLQKIGVLMNYLLNKVDTFSIGEIISASLDETQLQTQMGTEWVLCDGRSVVGSRYEAITGFSTIPDARGVFLRGKNNGRVDGYENPSGDLPLGTYQLDDIANHTHPVLGYSSNLATPTGGTQAHLGSSTGIPNFNNGSSFDVTIVAQGSDESRPTNITENYFIKIN